MAVSVNNNEANAKLGGSLTARTGGITADTDLTQNMDGVYKGKYGTLAVAGAASGGGGVTVAGALAIMVAQGKSTITVADGSSLIAENGAVNLISYDKSKLNAAAMAATVSGGSTVGVGASFALLYAKNEVKTQAGNNVTVKAKSFTAEAKKEAVDISDFGYPFALQDIVTIKPKQEGLHPVFTHSGRHDHS